MHLAEAGIAAEIVLTSGWALFAAAFAGIQYLSFSLIPGAFFVEVDYGRMVSPRYRAEWLRDSSRAGGTLVELERAMRLLRTEGAPNAREGHGVSVTKRRDREGPGTMRSAAHE